MINKHLVSVIECSKITGIGRDRLYHLVRTDPTLPIIRIGSTVRINMPLMIEWIDKATREGREL